MPRDYVPAAITADTPGAIAYTEYGGRSGTVPYTAYRMPTAAEQADRDLHAQIKSLPTEIQEKITSGEFTPQYTTVANGLGKTGGQTSNNGVSEFTKPGPNDTTIHYDLNGNQTAITQNEHGGGGWLNHAMGALGGGVQHVSDVLSSDPIAQAAALAALAVATGGGSLFADVGAAGAGLAEGAGAAMGAGSGLSAEALLGSELAAYPTAGIVGTIPEAAGLGSLGLAEGTGLASLESAGADAAASGALEGGASGIESVLTAGSAPGSELAATQGLGSLEAAGAPSILTAGSAPGSALAATTAAATPTAAELIAAGTTSGGTLSTALGNEAVASGTAQGSLGAQAAASGVLTDAQLAAATGAGGLGSLTGAETAAANLAKSANEAVASGTAPGSAGAAQAAAGTLTASQLAGAAGTGTAASTLTAAQVVQGIKDAKAAADALKLLGIGAGGAAVAKSLTGGGGNSGYQGTVPKYTASRTQNPVSETRAGIDGKPYRPGQGGVTYFSPMVYTPAAAKGGLMGLAGGGEIGNEAPQFNISLNTDQGNNYPVQGYPSRDGGVEQNGITQSSLPQTSGLQSLYGPSMQNFNSGGAVPGQYGLGSYSDGGRLLKGPGDGVSDSIPAIIGEKQPARLATGEFVIPARIVSELGNGSTEAGAQRLYEMMDRIQKTRRKTKNVAANTNAAKYLPA